MDSFLRIISLLSIPLTLFMFYMLARTVGKEQPARLRTYVLGIVMPSLMMIVNLLFMLKAFIAWCPGIWMPIIMIGIGFGYFWGRSSKLYKRGDILVIKRTVMHLGFWAVSYSITQLFSAVLPATIAAGGLATMFFSTGSSVGMNTNLILRQKKLDVELPTTQKNKTKSVITVSCPNCKSPIHEKYKFCIHCGYPLK